MRTILMLAGAIEVTTVVCWWLWAEGVPPWAVGFVLVLCATWCGIGIVIGREEV